MCFESIKPEVKVLFMKQVFEAAKINQESQHKVAAAGSCIAKGLKIHDSPEGRIQKINEGKNKIPSTM